MDKCYRSHKVKKIARNSPRSITIILIIVMAIIFVRLDSHLTAQTFADSSHLVNPLSNGFEWGCSAADFNSDGLVDIYHRGRMYLNKGSDGFENIISTTGITEGTYIFGAAFGDYDNDGYLDVLFEDFSSPSRLYRNKHDLTFTQTNSIANIAVNNLAQGAAWGDFNLDGKLDLFVNNDIGNNQLFKNLDFNGFLDISNSAGVATPGNSYGMSWGDYDGNGYPDVFIATCNSNPVNSIKHLLRNNGNETFTDMNYHAGVADSTSSWGIVWLDYDNDGDLDIYFCNTKHNNPQQPGYNKLYRNENNGSFSDVSVAAGVTGNLTENSYGCAAADFDNDGWIDIYVANSNRRHRLFRNNGDGTFLDIAVSAGIVEDNHQAVAVADFNNDGWLDIFTAGSPQNRLLFSNGGGNNWIQIQTRGVFSNHFGVGTRIEVYTGFIRQVREIRAGDSFCSQNDLLRAHFGLGNYTGVDSILIKWPGGTIDKIENVTVNRLITIVEGIGITSPPVPFRLLSPQSGDTVSAAAQIQLAWQDARAAALNNISYTIYVNGPGLDTSFTNISDTVFALNVSLLTDGGNYRWWVEASDGYSILASRDINTFVYQQLAYQTFNKSVVSGWNLLGLPLEVQDADYLNIFPNAVPGTLFGWDGIYTTEDSLLIGHSYWLRFNNNENVAVTGLPINSITTDLIEDWNMITGTSCTVAVTDVNDPGNIIIPGTLFRFDGAYISTDSIRQGEGYWVRTSAAGQVTISCNTSKTEISKQGMRLPDITTSPALRISDATGATQTLYFNVMLENPQSKHSFSMPPLPPAGAFDARFAGDYRISETEEGTILLQSSNFPVTIRASQLPMEENYTYVLKEIVGGKEVATHELQEGSTVEISNPNVKKLRLSKEKIVPLEFTVAQNYPNPFNPTTVIKYAIPNPGNVEIVVYNTLGQKVKTLVNGNKEAGYYEVVWDGSNDLGQRVGSGIYFYRVSAGENNSAMRKMVLLR